ncbi:MAG: hypothetical protein AABX66_03595 [Nanoarchaeota archaeon]
MNIQIKELTKEEAIKLSKDLVDFNPVVCLACGNKQELKQRFFLSSHPLESEAVNKFFKKKLMNKFGLTYYAYDDKNRSIITTAKCPECDGEKMDWDY